MTIYIYYTHSVYYELGFFLFNYLTSKNFLCKLIMTNIYVKDDKNSKDDKNLYILFGFIKFDKSLNYIVYQLEQTTFKLSVFSWLDKSYVKFLSDAKYVWDYSMLNINNYKCCKDYINKKNLIFSPIIFYKDKETIQKFYIKRKNKTVYKYDILFVGSLNRRRKTILRLLKKKYKYRYKICDNIFDRNKLEKIIMKSKILINIHSHEKSVLETVRICDMLNYFIPIVSEHSSDIILDHYFSQFNVVNFFNGKNYDIINDVLNDYSNYIVNIDNNYYNNHFSNNNFELE